MIPLLLIAAVVHPVHETLTEVEWNLKSQRLEVAIRFHQLDEQWLKKRYGRGRGDSVWAIEYASHHVRVSPQAKKGEPDETKYSWIGRQNDGAHVWWYFEIETKNRSPPEWIEHRILFERQANYTNRVLILNENPKRFLSLTKRRPRGDLKRESKAPVEP